MVWSDPFALLAIGLVAGAVLAVALVLRPWRGLPPSGPPWPWLAWCALLPLSWVADRLGAMPAAQPLPGACLLLLMAGWPLATLALVPVAAAAAWLGDLWLAGWGDAILTGMVVAIFVAFRPEWLATYTDRLYLPTRNGDSR